MIKSMALNSMKLHINFGELEENLKNEEMIKEGKQLSDQVCLSP